MSDIENKAVTIFDIKLDLLEILRQLHPDQKDDAYFTAWNLLFKLINNEKIDYEQSEHMRKEHERIIKHFIPDNQ